MILLPLIPIWSCDYFPSQDGFAHLYTVRLLDAYLSGMPGLEDFFVPVLAPVPNWVGQIFLFLTGKFVGLEISHRLLLTGCVVLFPLAFRWNLTATDMPGRSWLVFPLILNHFLFFGFYNYLLGIVLFLFLTGVLARVKEPNGPRFWGLVSVLCLLCYFCHSIAAGLAILAVLARFRNSFRANFLQLFLTLLPVGLMLLWYVAQAPPSVVGWQSPGDTFHQLLLFAALFPFSRSPELPGILWVLCLLTVFFAGIRRIKWRGSAEESFFPLLFLFSVLLCFAMPDRASGGAIVQYRLTILPWMFLCLIVPVRPRGPFLVLVFVAVWVYGHQLIDLQKVGREAGVTYRSYDKIMTGLPAGSVVLNLNEDVFGESQSSGSLGGRVGIYEHAHSVSALGGYRLVLLNHYQGLWTGFPFAFREKVDWSKSRERPELLVQWEEKTGRKIDYLVIQGTERNRLEAGWDGLFEADPAIPDGGAIRVWARKKENP